MDNDQVAIIGVFYGKQSYETMLQDDSDDGSEGSLETAAQNEAKPQLKSGLSA